MRPEEDVRYSWSWSYIHVILNIQCRFGLTWGPLQEQQAFIQLKSSERPRIRQGPGQKDL